MLIMFTVSHAVASALDVLQRIWDASTARTPSLDPRTSLWCAVLALIAVAVNQLWIIARNVITIVHEGGHALIALITGRRLEGIRLHSDTSGVTVSVGKDHGPGLAATRFAGYAAPSLCGLGCAAIIAHGYATGVLWLLVLALALLITRVRNGYGWITILVVGALVIGMAWFGDPMQRTMLAHVIVWFMLFGAIRPLFELMHQRATGQADDSDADQLGRTWLPAGVWIGLWLSVAVICLWLATRALLPTWSMSAFKFWNQAASTRGVIR